MYGNLEEGVMQNEANQSLSEISLGDLFKEVWKGKYVIIGVSALAAIISIFLSLELPNKYYSEAVLISAQSNDSQALSGQLGGLASLAGINLGGEQGSRTTVALEVMKSRKFINSIVKKHELAVPLIAVDEWDALTNTLSIDETIYNVNTSSWVRSVSHPYNQIPSEWELYRSFTDILNISEDASTGVIRVGIEYVSPYLAAEWVEIVVNEINQEMRRVDKDKAQKSIDYLNREIQNITVASTRDVFFNLIEEQLKSKMLVEVSPDYAFTVIDPPFASELKTAPKRSFIVLIVTFLTGFITTILFVSISLSNKKS